MAKKVTEEVVEKATEIKDEVTNTVSDGVEKAGEKIKESVETTKTTDAGGTTIFECLVGVAAVGAIAGVGYMAYQHFSNSDSVDFRIN